jgi:hypothetical protein
MDAAINWTLPEFSSKIGNQIVVLENMENEAFA